MKEAEAKLIETYIEKAHLNKNEEAEIRKLNPEILLGMIKLHNLIRTNPEVFTKIMPDVPARQHIDAKEYPNRAILKFQFTNNAGNPIQIEDDQVNAIAQYLLKEQWHIGDTWSFIWDENYRVVPHVEDNAGGYFAIYNVKKRSSAHIYHEVADYGHHLLQTNDDHRFPTIHLAFIEPDSKTK